jgi:hypothetical protein
MDSSSGSWGSYRHPHPWHSCTGGGAVHSINCRHSLPSRDDVPACVRTRAKVWTSSGIIIYSELISLGRYRKANKTISSHGVPLSTPSTPPILWRANGHISSPRITAHAATLLPRQMMQVAAGRGARSVSLNYLRDISNEKPHLLQIKECSRGLCRSGLVGTPRADRGARSE